MITTWLIRVLAFIGAFTLGKILFDFLHYQKDAKQYLSNCSKVQPGMTLAEAKKIMGDYDYYERENRSEIWTFLNNDTTKTYFLNYPTVALASEQTAILFDPVTQIVTGVACGDTQKAK